MWLAFTGVALLFALVGQGGGSGYLAVMALAGIEPLTMKSVALALNVLVSGVALLQFARAGGFDWRLFWPFALPSVPAAYLGGGVTPGAYFGLLAGTLLVLAGVRLALGREVQPAARRSLPHAAALLAGGTIGFVSGLTGIGGGVFLSPILLLGGWSDARRAAPLSAAFILVNSAAALLGHGRSLSALPTEFPLWAAGALVGGVGGAYLGSRSVSNLALQRLLAVFLVASGMKLYLG